MFGLLKRGGNVYARVIPGAKVKSLKATAEKKGSGADDAVRHTPQRHNVLDVYSDESKTLPCACSLPPTKPLFGAVDPDTEMLYEKPLNHPQQTTLPHRQTVFIESSYIDSPFRL